MAKAALFSVLDGALDNAYALSRPPGHHCLPDFPNGFCLLANIAIAIRAAQASGLARRVAVIDWDVHHGNGTEAIFYEDPEVLTVSIHQERNYPLDTGGVEMRGAGGRPLQAAVPVHLEFIGPDGTPVAEYDTYTATDPSTGRAQLSMARAALMDPAGAWKIKAS